MAATPTPGEVQAILDKSLAPMICGAFICVFAFGIASVQFTHFLQTFPNSMYWNKAFVVFLWTAQLAYTICICQGTYAMAVDDFGNLEGLGVTPRGLNGAQILGGIIDHPIQIFFILQIFRATNRWLLCLCLALAAIILEVVALYICVDLLKTHSISVTFGLPLYHKLVLVLFFSDGALDLVNAAVLCWHLRVQRQAAFTKRTLALVDHLVVYTLQTGFTTSLVAFSAAIAYAIAPENFIWVIFYEMLPCSFLCALLANLNNRGSLRFTNGNTTSASIYTTTTGVTATGGSAGLQIKVAQNIVFARDPKTSGSATMASQWQDGEPEVEMSKMELQSGSQMV
ncbi:hypothetical protein HMN09_00832900 [Mycena chlorophos]|uniref:DUF6534 domain-containing protein n=1 Tax=Mycena chlorophos TaxID=658473 RepID=A0A8H6SRS2_MYCCL|nr:hypothetical protein HMN09_00832900 [Mycena chlorophos]